MSFSIQNHAESFKKIVKNLFLDPKHAKLYQNWDFGHVRAVGGHKEDRDESMLTPEEAQAAAMNLALNALERVIRVNRI